MYKTMLVTLDTTATDRAILDHIKPLARVLNSHVVLLHVANGWAAQHFGADAISPEIVEDQDYLEQARKEFTAEEISCEALLAFGDPVSEILRWVETHDCDLIAMSTHGHKFVADLFLGETASRVQHNVSIPVLMLKAG